MKLPLEVTYRVGVGFIEKKYYEVNAEDVARIFYDEFKRQQKETSPTFFTEGGEQYG